MTTTMTDPPVRAARCGSSARPPARRRRAPDGHGLRYIFLGLLIAAAAGPLGTAMLDGQAAGTAESQALRSSAWNGGATGLISGERESTPGLDVVHLQNLRDRQRGEARTQFMPARIRD